MIIYPLSPTEERAFRWASTVSAAIAVSITLFLAAISVAAA